MNTVLKLDPTSCAVDSPDLYATETITTLDDLDRLESAWRSLGKNIGGPIEQFDWVRTCVDSARDNRDLNIATVTRGGRLTAVAPLSVKRVYGARRRVMLGVDQHHEPMDVLASDPDSLAQLAEHLAENRLPIILGRMPADSPSVQAVRAAFRGRGLVVALRQGASPYIFLDASWADPEKNLGKRRRSDLRRARRRAETIGKVTTEVLTPRPEELDGLLDEAFEVERHSWKGIRGTALSCDPAQAAFFRRFAHAASRQGILRLCFLRIGEQAVAMQVAITHGIGFWLLKIGYDARFATCSPGVLLLRESIAHAAREGFASYEFLGQSEPWIEVWTKHKRPCVALRVYPYNIDGAASLAVDAAAKVLVSAKQRGGRFVARLGGAVKSCVMPVVKRATRKYIAGDTLDDAKRVTGQLAGRRLSSTIGFWDAESQNPRAVADQYLAGLDSLAGDERDTYLSIKLPALCFSSALL